MSLIRCHECNAEISDLALSCPKCGAPPTSAIKQGKHNQKMITLNNELSRITAKNRNAKIVILVITVGFGIATFRWHSILDSMLCCGFFLAMLIANPYDRSMKKIKQRININDRLYDSLK